MDALAITPTDRDWMAHAFQLAGHGTIGTAPNPRVGCVVVRDGVLLSEGWHAQVGGPHAEVAALQALPPSVDARGATVYVTLEPCSHHGRTPPAPTPSSPRAWNDAWWPCRIRTRKWPVEVCSACAMPASPWRFSTPVQKAGG